MSASWMDDQARAGPSRLAGAPTPEEASKPMRAMLEEDHAAFTSLSEGLFSRLAAPSRTTMSLVEENTAYATSTLASMAALDQRMQAHLRLARQHARNQERIERLQEALRTREERTRLSIQEIGRIKLELDRMCRIASSELKYIDKAEQNPLSFEDILSYAGRLASVTSAPPGFKLPTQLPRPVVVEPAGDDEDDAEGKPKEEGKAKPPIAYYDPKMPSMPENLPFPDEGMIRRGALGALAAGQGVTFAPIPTAEQVEAVAEEGHESATQALSEEAQEELRRRQEAARLAREAEEADAFDLDLN